MDIFQQDKNCIINTYKRFDLAIVKGNGCFAYDNEGKEYIDLGTGIAVNAFGLADDAWVAAVTKQLTRLPHASNLYYTEPCAMLAKMLCERTGMKKVFFGNSGAEANECAIKAARKYAAEKKGEDCYTIVTLNNSFHGRTLATLSATGQAHYHELFRPLIEGFEHIDAGDLEALRALGARKKLAAVMIECVQGEGGVLPLAQDFARGVQAYCRENDVLLIVDEVQTGNGRTGSLYAYMRYGLTPDIVTTAKGLGGGLPLGACMLGEKVEHTLGFGDHGSTFGGNPVSCAGAVSILSRIDDALLNGVEAKSQRIFDALTGAPGVEGVSGLGLMIGVKTAKPVKEVLNACMQRGVLALSAKDRLRLLPALNIPDDLLGRALQVILEAVKP